MENFTFPADKSLVSTFSIMLQLKEKLLPLVAVHCPGPILDIRGMGAIFEGTFSEKRTFFLLALPKQVSFLTISKEKIFLKTQSTRLGAIVAPDKGLE